ncbi:MAG: hypothetical protein ABI970_15565 [Chloroflexota bacterium]|nr:tetratricopeptide repeat protein [Anaerolineae bacterium]
MRDSLDLAALKEQITQSKARSERNKTWIRYIQIAVAIMIAMSFVITVLYTNLRLRDKSLLILVILILLPVLMAYIFYPMFVTWRNIREYSMRIMTYAPDFVYRPRAINMIWELRSHFWLCIVLVSAAILHEQILKSPLVAILLYMLPTILTYIYNRIMVWVYTGGLPRVNTALKVLPASHRLLYFRAIFIYQNQQFTDAEFIIRKMLASRTDYANPNVVVELLMLSECWMRQQRFEEVMAILEAAIKISPIASLTYADLAEWYLDHEVDAERAVDLLDIALANTPTKQVILYAAQQAISAQALALTGRTIRAKASINTALDAIDKMAAITASEVNRRIGYAYMALAETEAARSHFTRAVELDPNGLYGNLARQALDLLAAPAQ